MAVAYASVAAPRGAWRHIGFTSFPKMPNPACGQKLGLGTFSPPRARREQAAIHDMQLQTRCHFGHSSPANRKTRVSYLIFTMVQTNVHMCFPYPLPRHPLTVLLDVSPTIAGVLCAIKREMFVHSSAPPDASGRTNGRGHFVPEVVSVYRNKAP